MNEPAIPVITGLTPPPEVGADAAWARIAVPLAPAALETLLDAETLLRLNPWLDIERFERVDDGHYEVRWSNQGRPFASAMQVVRLDGGLRLDYRAGLKSSTGFYVENRPDGGAFLWMIDRYERCPEAERLARLDEVDRSLTPWALALQGYCTAWARWSSFPPWRWYMRRVHLPMKPASRRIVRLLFWSSALELVVFVALVLWWRSGLST